MELKLFWIFFKFGIFCFGGGNTMIGVFEKTLVQNLHYLSPEQFANIVAVSQITPGPIAINLATYVGAILGETPAQSVLYAMIATVGIALPAFIFVLLVARFFEQFGNNPAVVRVMRGIKPGVIGLILGSVLLLCHYSIYDEALLKAGDILGAINWRAAALALTAGILAVKTKINPVALLIGSGIVGIFVL